jgi:hypothetical protein
MDVVDSVGMHGKCHYIGGTGYASYILEKDETAGIGIVGNAANWDQAASCLTGKNSVFLDAQYNTITLEKINDAANHGIPMEAWTITEDSQMESIGFDYITGVTSTIIVAAQWYLKETGALTPITPSSILTRSTNITGGAVVRDGVAKIEVSFVSAHTGTSSQMLSGLPVPKSGSAVILCMSIDGDDNVVDVGGFVQNRGILILPSVTSGLTYCLGGEYRV